MVEARAHKGSIQLLDIGECDVNSTKYLLTTTFFRSLIFRDYSLSSKLIILLQIKMGKMMDQGPVFIFSVTTQQVYTTNDKAGEILEVRALSFLLHFLLLYPSPLPSTSFLLPFLLLFIFHSLLHPCPSSTWGGANAKKVCKLGKLNDFAKIYL